MAQPYGITPPVFRLPADASVGAVRLQVAELQRSLDYYEHVLGLRVLDRAGDSAALGPRDATTPLIRLMAHPGARRARGELGLYHFAILLPDRAALGRFAAHVGALGVRVGVADHLVSEAFYLTDPDGLGIEVYADRPRDTWQTRDGELAMATDPLDVPDVIAAAAGEPWTGLPSGTTMGHIHLHVGDLRAAEAFYHTALGLDKTVWSYPGALFLAAGGYHHHVGTNTWSRGPAAAADQARLLDWELVVPGAAHAAADRVAAAGYPTHQTARGWMTADPWGTALHIVTEGGSSV